MKSKRAAKRVYEYVYICASYVNTREGTVLVLTAKEAFSDNIFESVFSSDKDISLEMINKLMKNILQGHRPPFHPKSIIFVTNIPEEYHEMMKLSKISEHRFVFDRNDTIAALKDFFEYSNIVHEPI